FRGLSVALTGYFEQLPQLDISVVDGNRMGDLRPAGGFVLGEEERPREYVGYGGGGSDQRVDGVGAFVVEVEAHDSA
ncbi:hypothetical protein AaE_014528, partial [Aphanomyces astaci]